MNGARLSCFFIMPFRGDLNFMYLYLKSHLEEKHALKVERGDDRILTIPIVEKIKNQIQRADVVIADISGRNPNVFYEMGIAHALGKSVILMTSDEVSNIPTDIRPFESIQYDLTDDEALLSKLDNAINNVFIDRYQVLYERAEALLKDFNVTTGSSYTAVGLEDFKALVIQGERLYGIPNPGNAFLVAEFLLPRIVQNANDATTMKKITAWLGERAP